VHRGDLIAGRYELVTRLGRGGMGEVWTCRDRELRRDVAVKFLALDDAVTPDLAQRFDREAVAAAQINHPNVVALHDRGVDKDHLYLVMERVEGTTLSAYLRENGPLPPGRALEIAQEICAALVAAHKAHVIHYDIKPLNVMLTADERVKVVDFGIAGFVQTSLTLTRSTTELPTAGTPEYGAPEQFGTERGDERSDLYALGGLLFALLTGQAPFTGPNGFAVVQRKLSEAAPSVARLRPDLPPAVVQLVDELLRREPDQRPQKAVEVYDRIARLRTALDVLDLSGATTVVAQGPDFVQPTRQLSAGAAFDISWTPRRAVGRRSPWMTAALWFCWLLFAAFVVMSYVMPSIYGSVDWQLANWIDFLRFSNAPGRTWSVAGIVSTLVISVAVTWLTRSRPAVGPWALRIGPEGITTADASGATASTGPSGRRTFAWNDIRMVTLEEIRAKMLNRESGLHIRLTSEAPYSGRFRPAGWIHPQSTAVRQDGSIPLCVLGPMTEEQHADLVAALNHHAGKRWHPEIGYLDGAI